MMRCLTRCRHSRESGNPLFRASARSVSMPAVWLECVPAFAGMTGLGALGEECNA